MAKLLSCMVKLFTYQRYLLAWLVKKNKAYEQSVHWLAITVLMQVIPMHCLTADVPDGCIAEVS